MPARWYEKQGTLQDGIQCYVKGGLQYQTYLSTNFHRSLDGTRTMNYGQWRSLADFAELVKDPKYAPLNQYWRDLAENEFHLYEVVFTKPAE